MKLLIVLVLLLPVVVATLQHQDLRRDLHNHARSRINIEDMEEFWDALKKLEKVIEEEVIVSTLQEAVDVDSEVSGALIKTIGIGVHS